MRGLLIFIAVFFRFTICSNPVIDAFSNTVKENINRQCENDQQAIKDTSDKAIAGLDQAASKGAEGSGQTAEAT
uniref:Secreted protein n=1 Tax=Nosema pernyi TaxID=1112939 RepID=X5E698_9MICR|nr:hypothetical protein NP_c27 [Nosema pernyi]